MSKGSKRRPTLVLPYEAELRWKLAFGEIDSVAFGAELMTLDALRHNTWMQFGQWGHETQALCQRIGWKYFQRWDGALGWIPAGCDFNPTFVYRLAK